MTMTKAEAIAYLLGTTCAFCGTSLPGPGQPCGSCGRIPDITSAELAADLDGPVALAAVEAAKLRAEAWSLHDQAVAKMVDADRAGHVALLRVRRDRAQKALDEHLKAQKKLYKPLEQATAAEEKAASDLAAATAEHDEIAREEELGRRYKHGLKARTELSVKLDKASSILREYRSALADASARRQAAEAALERSEARAALLENARDEAVAAHASPGKVPLSGETITAGGLRLVMNREMDDVEMAMAGFAARLICSATGVTSDIEAEARRQLLAEQETETKGKPLALAPLGQGNAIAAANPAHEAAPRPWDPPTTPRNPVVPGF